ncbi:MAG TPA: hydrolase [Clostridiaceae bacterium]|nr:hydrolase [Clostridiaceae bacterium]
MKDLPQKGEKFVPQLETPLRKKIITVPEAIYKASGLMIMRRRIKSVLFTTDIAIMRNNNANALMVVYPFTPELIITQAAMSVANVPVFAGVGGGTTTGNRAIGIAFQAELMGAAAVVVNSPTSNLVISGMCRSVDIPVIATVASFYDDIEGKVNAGARILNISGSKDTPELVRKARELVGPEYPIIATGGPTEDSILETIRAGANAITYTPPSVAEIFADTMQLYRDQSAQKALDPKFE